MTINVFPRHTRSVAQNRQMAADARFRATNNRLHGERLDCDTGMLEAQREIDRPGYPYRFVCESRTYSPFCVIKFGAMSDCLWDKGIVQADTWAMALAELREQYYPTSVFSGHAVCNTARQGVS